MAKASKENARITPLKLVLLCLIVAGLSVGGYFGYRYYQDYQAKKVYSADDTVGMRDFNIEITKADFKPVDLPIDKKVIKKHGALDEKEDCNKLSKEATWNYISYRSTGWMNYGPSDFNICIRRNDSRDEINKYSSANKQLAVDYKIVAKENVNTSDLKIELIPDSGRQLNKQVDAFNANQFFSDGAQEISTFAPDAPGRVYTDEVPQEYKPYHKSDIGGDINKGLERNGYIYTDIRNSENSVDLKISYNSEVRIIRITR